MADMKLTGNKIMAVMTCFMYCFLIAVTAGNAADGSIELRGPIYEDRIGGEDLANLDLPLEINGSNFAAFFFDIDKDVSTEQLFILPKGKNNEATEGRKIPAEALGYKTTIEKVDFEYDGGGWTKNGAEVFDYPVLGFFAEPYVPINASRPDKLARLLIDDNEIYILRTGKTLELGNGYVLEAKQIDVDGEKVWLEFSKDGEFIDDKTIEINYNETRNNWEVELDDIEGEDNVTVFRVHVEQVFRGAVDSLVQVDGLWLIDYKNAISIDEDDEFGNLKVVNISDNCLSFLSNRDITLEKGDIEEIGNGLKFRVANDSVLRFYVIKEFTEPGTYEIRGETVEGGEAIGFKWNSTNFAGFLYYPDEKVMTESLQILSANVSASSIDIDKDQLVYSTSIEYVDFAYDGGDWIGNEGNVVDSYPILGLFGEKFIPIDPDRSDRLAKLLVDNNEKYTLKTGEKLCLGEGYFLEARHVDVEGHKVRLEFKKDNEYIYSEIIDLSTGGAGNWIVDLSLGQNGNWIPDLDNVEEDDTVVLRVHVNQVFQSAEDSFVQIQGLWLIDLDYVFTIENGDKYGELEVTVKDDTIEFKNYSPITLEKESTSKIASDLAFKVANNDDEFMRFYPFIKRVIEDETYLIKASYPHSRTPIFEEGKPAEFSIRTGVPCSIEWEVDGKSVKAENLVLHSFYEALFPEGTYHVNVTAEKEGVKEKKSWELKIRGETKPRTGIKKLEFHGPVYEDPTGGEDLRNILNGAAIEMNGSNSIALFHTFREGVSTEQIFILPNGKNNESTEGRTISEEALEYKTTIKRIGYESEEEGWTEVGTEVPGYPILGFFAEPYVPINANRPDKLARLLIDSDEKYTLRSGDVLELGENYSLKVGKIDLEEEKVWLEFAKEGQYIREGIIETSAEATAKEKTWDVILDGIEGEDNVTALRVHIDEIFHDCTGNIIQIKGIWSIDFQDIFTIKAGEEFGKFEVAEIHEGSGSEQP
ncbi:MAG: S-layer protein domain-containing protein, partial [Methanosarcinaceae archaeon]|nr:S-layer protein domain-containing protein [Methanosarcinaceae archaeon]